TRAITGWLLCVAGTNPSTRQGFVSVIAPPSTQSSQPVIARVPVGKNPDSVALNPDGSRAYVTSQISLNNPRGIVSVIETGEPARAIATVRVGDLPQGIAVR